RRHTRSYGDWSSDVCSSDLTLFFSDRPQRVVGHLSSRKFVDQWAEGEDSFAQDPPNAVLSFLEDGDTVPEEVTMTISDPHLDGRSEERRVGKECRCRG